MAFFVLLKQQIQQVTERQWLLFSLICLLGISIVMVGSTSINYSQKQYQEPFHYLTLHMVYITMGTIGAFIASKFPMRFWLNQTLLWLLIVVLLLGSVFLFAPTNGAHRWIRFAGFSFQPSELAKLVMVLYTADYVVRRQSEIQYYSFLGFARLCIPLTVVLGLILLEPDLGSSVVIASVVIGMYFLAGARILHFLTIILSGVGALAAAILIEPYRLKRVLSFTDPWDDPSNSDLQLGNSLKAFGHGGFEGVGLGQSIQKLFYLPEAHTDFILAIIGEELGFIGVFAVFLLSALLINATMNIGKRALLNHHWREGFVAYGIAMIFILQLFVNGGMTMGMLPPKGLTLPFISYGGSALLVYLGMIGILLRIYQETGQPATKSARQIYKES